MYNANRGRALLAPAKPMSQRKIIPGPKVSQGTYSAFIPAPLPPVFDWTPGLVRSLSDADRLIGRLAGEGGRLANLTFSFAHLYAVKRFCRAGSKALKPHRANYWLPKPGLLSIVVRKICVKSETISLRWNMESPSSTNSLSAFGSSASCTTSS